MKTQSKLFIITMLLLIISSSVSAFRVAPMKYELEIPRGDSRELFLKLTGSSGSGVEHLIVYPTDISMDRSGALQFYRREGFGQSAIPWINLEREEIRLRGTKKEKLNFNIKVPRSASPGEYYAVLMVEPTEFSELKLKDKPATVKMKSRIAVVIVLNVPGRNYERKGKVISSEVTENEGQIHVKSTFKNQGNIHLDVAGKATIRSKNGHVSFGEIKISSPGRKTKEEEFIFPKNLLDFTGTLDKQLPPGEYRADISFDYGYDYKKAKDQAYFTIKGNSNANESEINFISVEPEKMRLGLKNGVFRTKTISVSSISSEEMKVSIETEQDSRVTGKNWLNVSPSDITLRPAQKRTLKVSLSIPEDGKREREGKILFKPSRGKSVEVPVEVMTPDLLKEVKEKEAKERARAEKEKKEKAEQEAKEKSEEDSAETSEEELAAKDSSKEDPKEDTSESEKMSSSDPKKGSDNKSGKSETSEKSESSSDEIVLDKKFVISTILAILVILGSLIFVFRKSKSNKSNSKNSNKMRKKNLLVLMLVAIFFASCSVQKQTIEDLPKKEETPILSKDSIQKLEQKELRETQKMAERLAKERDKRLAKQPKVSNVFVEASIRSVLMDISTQTGVNIIPDQTVEGRVSVEMNEVPLERALEMVLFPGGFDYKKIETKSKPGYYYLVGSSLPESFSFDALSETRVIKTNMDADKVLDNLSSHFDPYVTTNKDGNSITISGSPDIVKRIKTDIKRIDRSKRQIEISAVVATIQWKEGSNIGMNWGSIDLSGSGSMSFPGSADYTAEIVGNVRNLVKMRDERASVSVKAEPRLVVSEGEEANINLTKEHLFMIMSGGGMNYNYFTTKEFETGVKMDVKPRINRDGTIQIKITPEVADIVGEREFKMGNNGSQKLPIISRRSETTNVSLENGETFALGGLVMDSKKESESGTPILRSIPPISFFFKNKEKEKINTEMVIFITPKIIK